jgi:hypothetical protein
MSGGPAGGGRSRVPGGIGSPASLKKPSWTLPGALMIRSRPGACPTFLNAWTAPLGILTKLPLPAATVSFSIVNSKEPSMT